MAATRAGWKAALRADAMRERMLLVARMRISELGLRASTSVAMREARRRCWSPLALPCALACADDARLAKKRRTDY
jgi:hypothetical protein